MFKEGTAREIKQVNYNSVMADGATNTAGNCFCHSVLDGRQTTKLLNMQTQRVSKIISDAQLTVSVTKTRVRTYVIFGSRNV